MKLGYEVNFLARSDFSMQLHDALLDHCHG